MPIGQSAKKSLRQSLRRKKRNYSFKAKLKEIIKGFVTKPSDKGLVEAYSIVDKAVKNNLYKKNKANRVKSQLAKKLANPTETKAAAPKKTVKAKAKTAKTKKMK